ncbi:hypothetical protein MY04_2203 [Flammeovirga sp. MY04]|uniref:hypothetical protein n=1 Tax=Flammeovirga sp. MY04 TaxID=1191459 RepID=UPI0008062C40|nr:hypothetical protein [Flammeovirga sp. MY04]ANQ49577.1 hypothetical protein MY04_2203 [Flammeovirga sp. MY04]
MKWRNNEEKLIIFLLGSIIGSFVCYITLQFSYFKIKKELDIPSLLISIITILVGIYIANVIQKNVNSSQNKYIFLVNKIDDLWSKFNDFSANLHVETKMDISSIRALMKNVIHPFNYLNNIYTAFELNKKNITDLENKLEALEKKLSNCPSKENNIDFSNISEQVNSEVLTIQKQFSEILKELHSV